MFKIHQILTSKLKWTLFLSLPVSFLLLFRVFSPNIHQIILPLLRKGELFRQKKLSYVWLRSNLLGLQLLEDHKYELSLVFSSVFYIITKGFITI